MSGSLAKQTAAHVREFLASVESKSFLPAFVLMDLDSALVSMPADGLPPNLVEARSKLEVYAAAMREITQCMVATHRQALTELELMPTIRGYSAAMTEARAAQEAKVKDILQRMIKDDSRAVLEKAAEPVRLCLAEYRLGFWAMHDLAEDGNGDTRGDR